MLVSDNRAQTGFSIIKIAIPIPSQHASFAEFYLVACTFYKISPEQTGE